MGRWYAAAGEIFRAIRLALLSSNYAQIVGAMENAHRHRDVAPMHSRISRDAAPFTNRII
jgi:hypothetical protein